MRRLTLASLAVLALLAVAVTGAAATVGGSAATPGVTPRSVTIGGTYPLTGPASLYGTIPQAMKAYFSYINARRGPDGRRGVFGRQIVFKFYDDGYNPAQAIQLTRQLVEQDKVFAVVGSLGTEVNLGIRPYLNQRKVPQLLVATGASVFSADYKKYPWTTGWQPDYFNEARLYGQWIRENAAGNAKIGVIYQDDDYGKEYLNGLKAGLGGRPIADAEAFDVRTPDPRSQVAKLKAAGVDTLVIFLTPRATIQTYVFAKVLGLKPVAIYTNSVSATDTFLETARKSGAGDLVEGTMTAQYAKDPANPSWASDGAVKLYNEVMKKYYPGGRATDALNFYGVTVAHAFVQLLQAAGRNPTRAGIMKAARNWNQANPFLLPGNLQKTSGSDQFVVGGRRLIRYENGVFQPVTPLVFNK